MKTLYQTGIGHVPSAEEYRKNGEGERREKGGEPGKEQSVNEKIKKGGKVIRTGELDEGTTGTRETEEDGGRRSTLALTRARD